MAIEKRSWRKGTTWRVTWFNPITKERERANFDTAEDARVYEAEIKRRIKQDPLSFTPKRKEQLDEFTFAALAVRYQNLHRVSPSTQARAYYTLAREVIPHIGAVAPSALNKERMKALEAVWQAKGNSDMTIRRKMSVIKSVTAWAFDQGILPEDPLANYTSRKAVSKRIPPPTPAEVAALYDAAPDHLRRVILLAAALGARVGPSELFRIRWSDVHRNDDPPFARVWSAGKNKRETYRDVPLSPELQTALASWRAEDGLSDGFVIHYEGQPIKSIKRSWAATKRRAGIERELRPYDLRHYFATMALGYGADLKAVSMLMGHADTSMTLRTYQHVLEHNKAGAVALIPLPKRGAVSGQSASERGDFDVPVTKKMQ